MENTRGIPVNLFEIELEYNGSVVKLNPVKDSLFLRMAVEERETISSFLAYYGAVYSWQKKLLSVAKREREELVGKLRVNVEEDLKLKNQKSTESAIFSAIQGEPKYVDKSRQIESLEFNASFLEQAIWALKSKADNVKESIKPEFHNNNQ